MQHDKTIKYLNRLALVIFSIVLCSALFIMKNDIGLIEGMNFGPGSYYYTDIPGWQQIFYTSEHITPNTDHPILFLAFFIGWGLLMWKAWVFCDKKFK